MAATKTQNTQALDWTDIAGETIGESAEIDCSTAYDTMLHIDCAIVEDGAHLGTEIIVQVASGATNNDLWTDLVRFVGPTGTAISDDLNATETVGSTDIVMTTAIATSNLDNDGKFKFIHNTADETDSEIIYQVSNASSTITIQDGLTTEQTAANSDVFDIDDAVAEVVKSYAIHVPMSASRARVLFNNDYDKTAAKNVCCRVRATQVTALS